MSDIGKYLTPTPMLDFRDQRLQNLIQQRGWRDLSRYDAIESIYTFVRDEIPFGYNADDRLPASAVLKDGYGQCNTKGTLLAALFRGVGIPARFHGFTIYNALQRGAIPEYLFVLAPERIIHSWVEIFFEERWINLEGFIVDRPYLERIQAAFGEFERFSGYGIATRHLSSPPVDWQGEDTFIQREGIADDLGVYSDPDHFYRQYGSNLSGIKKLLFRYLIRHLMNVNVARIRRRGVSKRKLTRKRHA